MMAEDLVAPLRWWQKIWWRPSLYLCLSISLPLFSLDRSFSFLHEAIFQWASVFFFFIGRENLFFWPFVLTNGKNGWLSVLGSVFRECSFWSLDLSLLRSLPLYFSVSLFSRSLCLRFFIRIAIFLFSVFSSWFPFIPRGL